MLKFFLAILLIIFTINNTYSQFLNGNEGQILVKGVVTEKTSGKPIGVKITFKTPDGKKIKVNSNEITGEYQQLFSVSGDYEVIFQSPAILRSIQTLNIKTNGKYEEIKQDFTVEKIRSGATLDILDVFEKNSAELTPDGREALEELKVLMRFNRSLFINMMVTAGDSYKSNKAKDYAALVEKRKQALDSYLTSWRTWKERVNLQGDNATEAKGNDDIVVTVDKFEDVMK